MNWFERIVYFLQGTMERPQPFGWFHWMWIGFTVISLVFLYFCRKKYNEKQLKSVLLIYGVTALILEIIKQIIWSFNYDSVTNIGYWKYQWYSAPFQLCTTPIFVSLICSFLKDNKIRKALLSYMAFVTILGSLITMILPDSCFVETIEINIHTMWLHAGSLVVSIYLLMVGEIKPTKNNFKSSIIVFLIFVTLAQILNITIYNSGILNGDTFNMFYISPYFISTLPVFDIIQKSVPYIIYLISYLFVLIFGAWIIYKSSALFRKKYYNNK